MKIDKCGRFASTFDVDEAYALHTSGLSLGEIGSKLGVTKAAVSYAFKKAGFEVKTKSLPKCKISNDQILEMANSGQSIADISRIGGVTNTMIKKKLISLGFNMALLPSLKLGKLNLAVTYPGLVKQWSSKNSITPDKVYPGSDVSVWWTCERNSGHEWTAAPKDRVRLDRPSGCPYCAHTSSNDELFIKEFIDQFGLSVQSRVRGLLQNKRLEVDLFIPSLNIGIELNGQRWHCESMGVRPEAHFIKYEQAEQAGIRLLTIFDSELYSRTEAVEGYLLAILGRRLESVYARDCELVACNASDFIERYHIQGAARADYSLGLTHNKELVAAMAFRRVDNRTVELSRYCLRTGWNVPGAASRLLTNFIRYNKEYDTVISFSDNRWSQGNLYQKLGFSLIGNVKPSYWYFKQGQKELLHKFGFRKDAIESKFGKLLPNETEYRAMLRFGYDRVWDCGKKKWLLRVG